MKKIVMSALTLAIAACMSAAPVISASASDDFVCGTALIMKELAERNYEGIRLELPEKKYYKEGEELDLSGGKIYLDDVFLCYMDYTEGCYIEGAEVEVDTHQFISSSIPGVYPIHIRVALNGKEYYGMFCVCVEESEGSDIKIEDVEIGNKAKNIDVSLRVNKTPDKLVYNIGEDLDLTGGIYEYYIHETMEDGTELCACVPGAPMAEILYGEQAWYDDLSLDMSEFDNTKEGVYPIYIKADKEGATAEVSFEVEVKAENAKVDIDDVQIKDDSVLFGDVNLDGKVTISDSVRIMQYVANSQKYDLTDEQKVNADVYNTGDGVTVNDAAAIESYLSGTVDSLPLTF